MDSVDEEWMHFKRPFSGQARDALGRETYDKEYWNKEIMDMVLKKKDVYVCPLKNRSENIKGDYIRY